MADINDFKYAEFLHNAIFGSGKKLCYANCNCVVDIWLSEDSFTYALYFMQGAGVFLNF